MSSTPSTRLSPTHRWGIIGPGNIAQRFASALQKVDGSLIQAVASRSLERAKTFAEAYQIPNAYGQYEELFSDPTVEIVYIATPHPFHFPLATRALQAGKHVCCEKPLAMNAEQVRQLKATAQKHQRFLMEALWTHFLPPHVQMRQWIQEGLIGRVLRVSANFGFRLPFDPKHRVYNPALGGSALLDVGIYPLYLCQTILGKAERFQAQLDLAPTGVDQQGQAIFYYSSGAMAQIHCTVKLETNCRAWIEGTEGSFQISSRWHEPPATLSLYQEGNFQQTFDIPTSENGMEYQIMAVHQAIDQGKTQCPDWTPDDSLQLAETMDEILAQGGVSHEL